MGAASTNLHPVVGQCPSLNPLRSDFVQQSFDPSKLDGFWYEHAFIDIAQLGASCQTLNSTYDSASGKISMDFRVKYIGELIPFTINEVYTPVLAKVPGQYIKQANMPGGSLLQLPTVVVDVNDGGDDKYDAMTLYSCLDRIGPISDPWGNHIDELVFATRQPTIDGATLDAMKEKARQI